MLPLPIIAKAVGWRGGVAIALGLAAALLFLRLQYVKSELTTAETARDAALQRVATLQLEVRQAQATVAQAATINANLQQQLSRQRDALAGLKAEAERLDALAAKREREVMAAANERRIRDRERRARAHNPPADEMTTVLREAVSGL